MCIYIYIYIQSHPRRSMSYSPRYVLAFSMHNKDWSLWYGGGGWVVGWRMWSITMHHQCGSIWASSMWIVMCMYKYTHTRGAGKLQSVFGNQWCAWLGHVNYVAAHTWCWVSQTLQHLTHHGQYAGMCAHRAVNSHMYVCIVWFFESIWEATCSLHVI